MNASAEAELFVYGTLRDPAVQRSVFGRTAEGKADALRGHAITTVTIDGTAYRSLVPSGRDSDRVEGLVLRLRDGDLALADAYEGATDYVRVSVRLESGRDAFVYVSAGA